MNGLHDDSIPISQLERATQNPIIAMFRDELGYRALGDWTDRDGFEGNGNSNIEDGLLSTYLTQNGYSPAQISRALDRLHTKAGNPNRSLYDNNKSVYSLLRYGVPVKAAADENTETVWLINWENPAQNDFAIAEVTLMGNFKRRPDLVLYVNGIAVGVIELKNSRVSIGDGIRQSISNQQPEFNAWFFSTVQFIIAGNDSEGLQYGTIKSEEKYFLKWKEDEADNSRFKQDKYLLKLCNKARLIELMHDFVLFDGGVKKLPRVHQYFGIKAAQAHVHRREGGIIWHTQGSGKSIVMVLLAKWILENKPNARVVIVTDRDELDKQIEGVFIAAGHPITRTSSGRDLMTQLGQTTPRLLCSLVHKFGKMGVEDFGRFIQELEAQPCQTVGELFVFVDECHRTQRGNAILVASSIYEACKYFDLFQKTVFKGKCAVVTSYNPQVQDITLEDTGANTETDKQFIYNIYTALLENVEALPGKSKTETYEDHAKKLFKEQPANMKLLVVVDKLLIGFDAPSCTYLYIDKRMQDHGLFQAICRTNRLDGEDKDFGYIVDYKDLFKKVENAIAVYTFELDDSTGGGDPEILLQDRLTKGRERLDNALEAIAMLCEPVQPPKGELEHIHYFSGNTEIPDDLQLHETQRLALYKATVALVRAYANIADELDKAGYNGVEIQRIKQKLDEYLKLREIIRNAANEKLDMKAYEAEMRHLFETYIEADEPRTISPFDNMPLLELIVKTGIANAINSLPDGLKGNKNAVAETIENNVRSKIIKEHLNDPANYDKMSAL